MRVRLGTTITLLEGDCLPLMQGMASDSVDAVITDPPYGVRFRGKRGRWPVMAGDGDMTWVANAYAEMYRVLRPDTFCVSFYGWPQADAFIQAWTSAGFRMVSHLVCVKNIMGLGHVMRSRHEQAYVLAKGRPRPTAVIPDVVPFVRDRHYAHPTQKPVGTIAPLVETFCPPNGLVLDPFMGSGSTGMAAVRQNRRFVGIELETQYFKAARARISDSLSAHRRGSPCA